MDLPVNPNDPNHPTRKTTKLYLSQELEKLKRRTAYAEALAGVALRRAAGESLDSVLTEAARDTAAALEADVLCFLLRDEEKNALLVRSSVGLDLDRLRPLDLSGGEGVLELAREHVPGWIWAAPAGEEAPTLAFLPLSFREATLGVLMLGRAAGREAFDADALRAAKSLAAQVAGAAYWEGPVRSLMAQERTERELHFAHALKAAILHDPPTAGGDALSLGFRRCVDAAGDFWDALPLADGRLAFLLGECSGRGLRTATGLAVLLHEVRGALLRSDGPGRAIAELNHALVASEWRGQMVSLALGVWTPGTRTLRLARVGGTRVLQAGGSRTGPAEIESAGPIGVLPVAHPAEAEIRLGAGEALLLATEGAGRLAGNNLAGMLAAELAGGASGLAARVMARMRSAADGEASQMDATLLCFAP